MATVEALKERKDIELMKTVLKERNIRHYLLFIIGCNTGLRIGDILRLKVSDFVSSGKVSKYLQVKEEKTGKERRIAINASIQKAMKLYMSHCRYAPGDYLFTSRKGENRPISTTQAYRILNDAAGDCRLDINFGTHTMRKTWAYHTYRQTGNNLGLVMDMPASGIICIHNHPSGDPEPSNEDIETTKRLVDAGNILGIKVLDHIIIGDGRYISLKEKGLI